MRTTTTIKVTVLAMALALLGVLAALAADDVLGMKVGERIGPLESAYLGHQHGSEAKSKAGDISLLYDGRNGEGQDDQGYVEDRSCGNGQAIMTFIDGGRVQNYMRDGDGCQGTGYVSEDYERNFGGHVTCKNYSFGAYRGCGFQSGHGN